MKMLRLIVCGIALISTQVTEAQDTTGAVSGAVQSTEEEKETSFSLFNIDKSPKALKVNGYYRFLNYHRNTSDFFTDVNRENAVYEADDEFFSPTLNVNIGLAPTSSSEINFQYFMFTPRKGIAPDLNQLKLSRNGVVVSGAFKTKNAGTYNIWLGGINPVRFSTLTLASAQQVRNSLFDRSAWTWVFGPNAQYGNYYGESDYKRDIVWGKRSVNGVGATVTDLPGNIEIQFLFGKTPFNLNAVPDNILGAQIKKNIGLHNVYLNFINSNGKSSTTNGEGFGGTTTSLMYSGNLNEYKLDAEIAFGSWYTPTIARSWDNATIISLRPPKRASKIPLKLEFYRIGANFSNANSSIINTSVEETQFSFAGDNVADGARPESGVMAPIHLKANNRTGFNLNGEVKFNKFSLNFGHGISSDIQRDDNNVAFYHKVTGLYLARNARFSPNYGPYGSLTTFFRGAYEVANVYDTSSTDVLRNTLKYNIDLINLKYATKLLGRNLYVFYLGEYQSVQGKWSPIPKFNDDAYIRAAFHEFDLYYNFLPKFSLVGYYGMERILGNQFTDQGESGGYRNQKANVLGIGVDVNVGKMSALYLRTKWLEFEDPNFDDNHFKAFEGSVEFKVYF